MLSRQHHLTALSEILPVLNGHIDCRHLDTATEGVGEAQQTAVALGGGQLKRCGLLAIIVEERIGTFYLYLCVGLEVVVLALF